MKEKEKGHGNNSHHPKKEAAVDRALNGAIAVLFIIALVLGYAIYVQRNPSDSTPPKPKGPVEQSGTESASPVDPESYKELTEEQRSVLVVPGSDAPEADRQGHFERVDKAAVESTTVEIKDCVAVPLVLKTKKGNTVTYKNGDNAPLTLTFGEEKSVSLAAGATQSLLLDFVEAEGIHTYHCDGHPNPAGLLYMVR